MLSFASRAVKTCDGAGAVSPNPSPSPSLSAKPATAAATCPPAVGDVGSPPRTEHLRHSRPRICEQRDGFAEFAAAWSQCSAVLQDACDKAPHGDSPPSSKAPYSAAQLAAWASECAGSSKYRLPTRSELQVVVRATVLHIAAFNRQRLAEQLGALQDQEVALELLSKPESSWFEALRARHGADSLLQQLRELSLAETEMNDLFAPMQRLACRVRAWRRLVTTAGGPAPMDALVRPPESFWPPRCVMHNLEAVVESSLHMGTCPVADGKHPGRVSPQVAAVSSSLHVQLRLRLSCLGGGPLAVRRITIAEDVGAVEEHSSLEADVVEVARRDVVFEPPARLEGRGSCLLFALKMPATAKELFPPLFLFRVVTIEVCGVADA